MQLSESPKNIAGTAIRERARQLSHLSFDSVPQVTSFQENGRAAFQLTYSKGSQILLDLQNIVEYLE